MGRLSRFDKIAFANIVSDMMAMWISCIVVRCAMSRQLLSAASTSGFPRCAASALNPAMSRLMSVEMARASIFHFHFHFPSCCATRPSFCSESLSTSDDVDTVQPRAAAYGQGLTEHHLRRDRTRTIRQTNPINITQLSTTLSGRLL